MKTAILVTILALCFTIDSAQGLKCYACGPLSIPVPGVTIPQKCDKPVEADCPAGLDICYTMAANKDGISLESKSCMASGNGLEESCNQLQKEDGGHCRICKSDLCNSAMQYKMATGLATIIAFLLIKFSN